MGMLAHLHTFEMLATADLGPNHPVTKFSVVRTIRLDMNGQRRNQGGEQGPWRL
jgi:hypothetical protein